MPKLSSGGFNVIYLSIVCRLQPMGSANESASCLLFVNVHDLRLPYVVSIDFPQYKVEIEA